MRRVVAAEYVSIDGVMQDPGRAGGFERGAGRTRTGMTNSPTTSQISCSRATRCCLGEFIVLGLIAALLLPGRPRAGRAGTREAVSVPAPDAARPIHQTTH
jgi:hypothetical protein